MNARTGEVLVEGHEHANPEDDHLPTAPPRSRTKLVVTAVVLTVVIAFVGWLQAMAWT